MKVVHNRGLRLTFASSTSLIHINIVVTQIKNVVQPPIQPASVTVAQGVSAPCAAQYGRLLFISQGKARETI